MRFPSSAKAFDSISSLGAALAGGAMLLVALFMSYEAFSRHFLNHPTSWVLAVSVLIFIWFTFLAAAHGIRTERHVACDVFISRLSERSRAALGIAKT